MILEVAILNVRVELERAFEAARECARVAMLAWRERAGDWQTAARLRYLSRAVDLPDLERRQRTWERDESNSYSMSGWP
jgi:hypothetical protein